MAKKRLANALCTAAITIAVGVLAYGTFIASHDNSAAAAPQPACKTFTTEADCMAREDCSWVKAVVNPKTGKETRKAYCRAKPKTKKK